MSAGFRAKGEQVREQIKYWLLREELQKREIALTDFAQALDLKYEALSGKGTPFPIEKLQEAVELLNNWTGPRRSHTRNARPMKATAITAEMLLA